MSALSDRRQRQGGQVLILFVLFLTSMLLAVGLVVDGGWAYAQQRGSQNAADFGALAGAQVVAMAIFDNNNGQAPPNDAAVLAAIQQGVTDNGSSVVFGAPNGPQYVDANGAFAGYVGASGGIPSAAVGVEVGASKSWAPFFLGVIGITSWTASASATAKGGYLVGAPGGNVVPVGVSICNFPNPPASANCSGTPPTTFSFCPSTETAQQCGPQQFTSGGLNVPGGFDWLKFGCYPGNDLPGGCSNSKPFLQTEFGHPNGANDPTPGNSYGCCGNIPPGSVIDVGSLTGNKPSDISYYVDNNITVLVPIYKDAKGSGSNAYYEIVGFAGMQLTAADTGASGQHGKWIQGVWRQAFFTGPTTTTPSYPGQALAVELIR